MAHTFLNGFFLMVLLKQSHPLSIATSAMAVMQLLQMPCFLPSLRYLPFGSLNILAAQRVKSLGLSSLDQQYPIQLIG